MMGTIQIPKNVQRFPRLDTILMVEKFIQKYDGEFKRKEMWERLPKSMMYQTFKLIIEYLLYSHRITMDAEGKIGWLPHTTRKIPPSLFWREDAATR